MSSSGNPLELSSWGLPPEVLRRYNELGITHMFEWQADCLRTGKVLTGGKLVSPVVTVELSRLFEGNLSETAGGRGKVHVDISNHILVGGQVLILLEYIHV